MGSNCWDLRLKKPSIFFYQNLKYGGMYGVEHSIPRYQELMILSSGVGGNEEMKCPFHILKFIFAGFIDGVLLVVQVFIL